MKTKLLPTSEAHFGHGSLSLADPAVDHQVCDHPRLSSPNGTMQNHGARRLPSPKL
jgi:hypothetical protein